MNSPDVDAVHLRYAEERRKRRRDEGLDQYRAVDDDPAFAVDPWAGDPPHRQPVSEECDVVIVGGGFSGMFTAINLRRRGVSNIRIVEKAGDFGGTWYWNRYPGCMCDVESYIYMPYLEETGHMPTQRYASASEIFEHCQRIARHFDLYPSALFYTEIADARWDDGEARWTVATTRGDVLRTRFVVAAGGILHKAKLPRINGLSDFSGVAFHTARWDYGTTGGSPTQPMDRLGDARVGVIGTGATSIQVVPQLAAAARELFVFQRTPSAVGARNNRPTDPEWFRSLPPGWQAERTANFTDAVTGGQPQRDLVSDGWTDALWVDTQTDGGSDAANRELDLIDLAVMDAMRRRVDDIVDDPTTAELLKPWYGKHCKRLCFHDEYLQAFNRPNVHLVDTGGRGVADMTPRGPVVDGIEYPVDVLIIASGFEVTTGFVSRLGFDPIGRNGVRLGERWADGAHTLHGILSHGFPNFLVSHFVQAGFALNFTHYLGELSQHISWLVATLLDNDVSSIEATVEAEDAWLATLWGRAGAFARYASTCTPSYGNSEGSRTSLAARNIANPGNFTVFMRDLEAWRADGSFAGTVIGRAAAEPGTEAAGV